MSNTTNVRWTLNKNLTVAFEDDNITFEVKDSTINCFILDKKDFKSLIEYFIMVGLIDVEQTKARIVVK